MTRLNRTIYILACFFIVACGAGGSQTAGIDRGGVVSGPVTGYGSIWVNGSRYLTDTASITVNGATATEAGLAIGQVVLLDSVADENSLRAETIIYESNLQGPIESVDVAAATFVALGQIVLVDAGTSFGPGIVPADITALAQDDIVQVSGLVDTAGNIRATRIDLEDARSEIQLSGTVTAITGMQFAIGAQLVDYSQSMLEGFPGGTISNGDRVRVIGASFGSAGEIVASAVAYRGSRIAIADGEDGDIEGLITEFAGPQSFRLAGFAVLTTVQTEFSGGAAGDLANNVRIEAEGSFDADGTLVADKIEFREEGEARIEATVDSTDVAQNTVTVFGVKVELTPLTRIEDKRDERRPFGIADIEPGDFLKIEGSWNGDRVIAGGLERIAGEDNFELRGQLLSVNEPEFTVLGIVVRTGLNTEFDSDAASFFAAAANCVPDCIVEAVWSADGDLLLADKVEFED